jgi:hypothetical protein
MATLMLVFAFAIGFATFIENSYDTITAKRMVYHASWFYGVMILLAINFWPTSNDTICGDGKNGPFC